LSFVGGQFHITFEQARNAATMRFRFSSTLAVALSELNCGSALACAQAFANE
jgi:hypothetical protein